MAVSLAEKQVIEFHKSLDLKNWAKVGSFAIKQKEVGIVWECPDLFKLRT